MTLIALSVLIIAALVFALLKWRRTSYTLYLISLLTFLAIGCGFLPNIMLANLQSPYAEPATAEWNKRNAIVILGAGTVKIPSAGRPEIDIFGYGRIAKGASLYNECKQKNNECKIIVSGGDARNNGISEASIYSAQLRGLGVSNDDLLLEDRSMNTWQNAQFSSQLLQSLKVDRILLVSSGTHLRRSVLYFSHFGVSVVPARADYVVAPTSVFPAAFNFALADFAIHEYVGIVRYHLYNALGWNAAAAKHPGAV
ncbi:MAG: YdcF family protein [Pseudomonadota bacterium]